MIFFVPWQYGIDVSEPCIAKASSTFRRLRVSVWDRRNIKLKTKLKVYKAAVLPTLLYACDCLFVGCLTSQQYASESQGRTCSDNFTCCHTEIEVADQTFYLTQSQCTDTGPTSPSADPITPGAWQSSHWNANF